MDGTAAERDMAVSTVQDTSVMAVKGTPFATAEYISVAVTAHDTSLMAGGISVATAEDTPVAVIMAAVTPVAADITAAAIITENHRSAG
jgi:hypothetical protein